ncbi:class I lanthipeptide [Kordia sp.]|uniref:class I lanthipeptide n=1 Tax=Kordia sp. TaxID=1965332 RepID=UPI003D292E3D
MKKKSIKKLALKKDAISTLNANSVQGGTWQSVYLCESVNWCETRDYTRCNGNRNCGIFDPTNDF